MKTRDRLLLLLEERKGEYVSGAEVAGSLYISRTAIWKAVESLRAEGYTIEAVRNRGYRLPEESDLISEAGIRHWLGCVRTEGMSQTRAKSDQESIQLYVRQKVTSTNDLLKEMAATGAPEGTVYVAARQTAGKGRAGRSFYSPEDTGVYLSILLRPEGFTVQRASRFTTMAAVAACRAIDELIESQEAGAQKEQAQIKWVNDVYVRGRKAVGILTEAGINLESGELEYAVLGIGFNVYAPKEGFPEEIRDRAGAILRERTGDAKNQLAAAFIRYFMYYYKEELKRKDGGQLPEYVRVYQERCFVVGREIDVIAGGKSRRARALSVDDECRLAVEYENGSRETLASGEVSIRV